MALPSTNTPSSQSCLSLQSFAQWLIPSFPLTKAISGEHFNLVMVESWAVPVRDPIPLSPQARCTQSTASGQTSPGSSAVATALTGMSVSAAVFLIPLGVYVYVVLGGLRATFLCDYSHTIIVMLIILYFMFDVYTTNGIIGSPSSMYELLQTASAKRPVDGNIDGSLSHAEIQQRPGLRRHPAVHRHGHGLPRPRVSGP
ncbi:uncharacterized protein BDV17DRAFT_288392 [Aspergillus undulatus]|uniref:uncharacterized protein n=1 Tax=Aspergillus undulatus TaxID=1810928 RepID=UPI003CCD8776